MHTYSQDKTGRNPVAQPRLQKKGQGAAGVVQTKLSIGQPGDAYEQEADSIADQVVHQKPAASGLVQKQKEEKPKVKVANLVQREPKEELQMKPETSAKDAPANIGEQITSTEGSGMALPPPVRREMESGIGANFNQVRIHTGPKAENMSQQLNAQAFTLGSNIYFNKGKYNPGSHAGKHLLAHELTHTVQQGKSSPMIQREVTKNAADQPEGMEFTVGTELPEAFVTLAGSLVIDGDMSTADLYKLREWAITNHGTVDEFMRLFMAGLLDPNNIQTFSALNIANGVSFTFPLTSITSANKSRVNDLNRDVDLSEIESLSANIGPSYMEGGLEGMGEAIDEREKAITTQIRELAGSNYLDQINEVIAFADANSVSLHSVMMAMINAASDSTQGDRTIAAMAYLVSRTAGLNTSDQVLNGQIQIDALSPTAFNSRMSTDLEAAYAPQGANGEASVKGDTIYFKDDMHINNLGDRTEIVHELVHARRDGKEPESGPPAVVKARTVEFEAYTADAKYALESINQLDAADRPAAARQVVTVWNSIRSHALLYITKKDESTFRAALTEIVSAKFGDPTRGKAAVASALGRTEADIESLLYQHIDANYTATDQDGNPAEPYYQLDGLAGGNLSDWIYR